MKCIYFIYSLLYVYGFWWFIVGLLQSVDDRNLYNFTYADFVKKQDISTEIIITLAAMNMFISVMFYFDHIFRTDDPHDSDLSYNKEIKKMEILQMFFTMCGLFTIIINIEYVRWPVTYAISCVYAIALLDWSNDLEDMRKHVKKSNQLDELDVSSV